jgi:heme oxygenase
LLYCRPKVEQSGLLARLNIATRQWHADVDEPWLDLLRPDTGRANYLSLLVRTYGFVAPFEGACKYTPNVTRLLEFQRLSRAGLIARDLLALGLSPSQVANVDQCPSITTFKDVSEALGWLYVVERATLLHDGIHRRLLSQIPDIEDACTYLRAHGGRVAEQWTAFGRLLDRVGAKPDMANEIVAAANDAFACVKQWFRTASVEPRRSTA